jgi:hypothetical protein
MRCCRRPRPFHTRRRSPPPPPCQLTPPEAPGFPPPVGSGHSQRHVFVVGHVGEVLLVEGEVIVELLSQPLHEPGAARRHPAGARRVRRARRRRRRRRARRGARRERRRCGRAAAPGHPAAAAAPAGSAPAAAPPHSTLRAPRAGRAGRDGAPRRCCRGATTPRRGPGPAPPPPRAPRPHLAGVCCRTLAPGSPAGRGPLQSPADQGLLAVLCCRHHRGFRAAFGCSTAHPRAAGGGALGREGRRKARRPTARGFPPPQPARAECMRAPLSPSTRLRPTPPPGLPRDLDRARRALQRASACISGPGGAPKAPGPGRGDDPPRGAACPAAPRLRPGARAAPRRRRPRRGRRAGAGPRPRAAPASGRRGAAPAAPGRQPRRTAGHGAPPRLTHRRRRRCHELRVQALQLLRAA